MAEQVEPLSVQERFDAETAYLLRCPAGAQRLRASIAGAQAGEVQRHDLIDPDAPSAGPSTR